MFEKIFKKQEKVQEKVQQQQERNDKDCRELTDEELDQIVGGAPLRAQVTAKVATLTMPGGAQWVQFQGMQAKVTEVPGATNDVAQAVVLETHVR